MMTNKASCLSCFTFRKEQTEGEKIEYNKVLEKLFGIVEKVTERLAKLEKLN
jgi:hypothetical protein